ncbi:P-selectin-like [Branchiostoma floridae x Branchiostoma japonicum]
MPKDAGTNDFIIKLTQDSGVTVDVWIGLSTTIYMDWVWSDGSKLDGSSQAWAPNEPGSNRDINCARLSVSGTTSPNVWKDIPCDSTYGYICQKAVQCASLSEPSYGTKTSQSGSNGYFPGDSVNFGCQSGYSLNGDSVRTCQSDGTWSGTQPTCDAVQCASLLTPSNGIFTPSDSYSPGDRAYFWCQAGYSLNGDYMRTCQSDGTWSGTQPTCDECRVRF